MKYGDQSLHVYQIMMQYVVCKNEEHYSFLVDSPRYDERARELSTEAGTRSFQKASKMGQAAESRGEYVEFEEATRANVGEIAAGVLRERDEPTLICPIPDGEPFHPNERQFFFHVALGWNCIGRSELM